MAFTGGAPCWNGPARSIRARLTCGPVPELRSPSEPNRCEYEAELITPAACSPEAAAAAAAAAKTAEVEAAAWGKEEL